MTDEWMTFRRSETVRLRERPQPDFYESAGWLRLRYAVLRKHGGHCLCCGERGTSANPLQVDHIKPRSKYPELELDPNNLQILCKKCNRGKGNWDETDWRRLSHWNLRDQFR